MYPVDHVACLPLKVLLLHKESGLQHNTASYRKDVTRCNVSRNAGKSRRLVFSCNLQSNFAMTNTCSYEVELLQLQFHLPVVSHAAHAKRRCVAFIEKKKLSYY